ncbi:hypothetical protein PM082_007589 [Marasmius tenuissimus]|nr:hypothetical protein PM082_007589 [Marasmius tenuissimus]
MEDHPLLLAGFATACAVFVYTRALKSPSPAPLPPGPKGLPLIGNVLDLPQTQAWLTFAKWAEEYGPITHVRVPGLPIIVLNDATCTSDLLDKKGRQYSDRPRLVMGGELVGWDQGPALAQFGKPWSDYRRIMAQFLGSRSKIDGSYGRVLEEATHQYLKDLLSSPAEWVEHGRRFAAAIVLQIAFGYKAESKDDPLISIVDEAVAQFSETTAPNAYAVDTFPFLRYVPEWFPGAGWKKKATHYRKTLEAMLNLPFDMVKMRMAEGTSTTCVVSDLLSGDKKLTPEEEENIKWAAAGIYSGELEFLT